MHTEESAALRDVNLVVERGDFACISGASGSGKSTLLMVAAGIIRPDSGEVEVLGEEFSHASESFRANFRLRNIGVIFQSNNLLSEFTAAENIALPLLARRMASADVDRAVRGALDEVELGGLGARFPSEMSGGQRQRVGIARALAGGQRVVLADEPTGALDSEQSRRLFALFGRICTVSGISVVLATHDPIAREFTHRSFMMTDGVLAT